MSLKYQLLSCELEEEESSLREVMSKIPTCSQEKCDSSIAMGIRGESLCKRPSANRGC